MNEKTFGVRFLRAAWLALSATALATCSDRGSGERSGGAPQLDPVLTAAETTTRTAALATRPSTGPTAVLATQAVGATPGSGWVGHDGAYHYRIPIEVPAGRAGMAPAIALAYSSRAGNSEVGVGFSVDGSSSITRCDSIIAAGGVRDRVLFKKYDNYCLDGQRLMLLTGNAGEAGAEYRTELDNFTRVRITTRSGGDITKWTAETKDGRTLIYEPLADTVATDSPEPWTQRQPVMADGTANGTPTTFHLAWPLTKQYDRSGNGMRYSYVRSSGPTNDGGGDAPLLSQIDYTTCEITPCDFPDTARPRRVVLTYEPRPATDVLERWVNGVVVRTKVRLKFIQPQVQTDDGIWWPQRTYHLQYWTDDQDPANQRLTRRSLLQSVMLCEGFDPRGPVVARCLTPTTFDWQSRAQHKLRSQGIENGFDYAGLVAGVGRREFTVVDANGDGNDDLLLHEGSGTPVIYKERVLIADGGGQFKSAVDVNWNGGACKGVTNLGMALPVDLDGDGKTEVVVECGKYGVLAWNPALGTLAEVNVPGISNVDQPDRTADRPNGREGYIKFLDLTGDGLPELLTAAREGTETFHRWQRRDAQSGVLTPAWGPQVSYAAPVSTAVRVDGAGTPESEKVVAAATTVLDLDGDGHQELAMPGALQRMRSYSDPPGLGRFNMHSYRFHDVPNNVKWVSEGEDAVEPTTGDKNWWTGATVSGGTQALGLWYFADVNGDGLKDALHQNVTFVADAATTTWLMRINTGEGFLPAVALDKSRCEPKFMAAPVVGLNRNLIIADLNGDGRDDLVKLSYTSLQPFAPNGSGLQGTRDPIQVCYSNGSGFEPPINLPMPDGGHRMLQASWSLGIPNSTASFNVERFPMTQTGDFNGDGIAEIVDFQLGSSGDFAANQREPVVTLLDPDAIRGGVDLITKVSDAHGMRQQITYDSLSAGTRARFIAANPPSGLRDTHLPGAGRYPEPARRKGAAVRKLGDEGHATPGRSTTTLHLYEDSRDSSTGRGFLGFARHYTIDQTTGDATRYEFRFLTFSAGDARYLYPTSMRPSGVQTRAEFSATTELALPAASLPAPVGPVPAPYMSVAEIYEGSPLRLEHIYQDELQRTRTNGGPVTDTGARTFREIAYDDWGNIISERTETTETADPSFTAFYTRNVTTQFDNTVNATTWRLGEARRIVDTTTASDPYRTGADASDTRTTSFTYDGKGRLGSVLREPGGANNELLSTTYARNRAGQVTSVSRYAPTGQSCGVDDDCDESKQEYCAGQCWRPRIDRFGYDVSGTFPESFTNALGETRWVLYHPRTLLPYLIADENGVETTITRDGLGRVRETRSATHGMTTTNFASGVFDGRVYDIVRTSEPSGARQSVFIHPLGMPEYRSWSTFSGGSGASLIGHDPLGNLTVTRYKSSSASEADVSATVQAVHNAALTGLTMSQATYDRASRLLTSARGITEMSAFAYPAYGTTAVTDGEGISSSTTVDSAGRVVTRTQGGREIHYRYKGDGPIASIVGSDNHIERFFFDKLGRKTQWTTGLVGSGTAVERLGAVSYDTFDQMTAFSRDGVAITQTYDALGRITNRASGNEAQTYVWGTGTGEVGRLKRAYHNDLSHDTVNSYNSLGQLIERREKFANGTTSLSFGYEYDNVGRLYRLRYPEANGTDVSAVAHTSRGGPTVQYNYQNGQLGSITEVASGNPILWRADTRHVLGMVTGALYGAPSDTNRLTATWGYNDNTLRLESQNVARINSGTAIQTFGHGDNGTLETHQAPGLNETYTYSGLGFLDTYHRDNGAGQKLVDAIFSYDHTGITGVDTTASNDSTDWGTQDETFVPLSNPSPDYRLLYHTVGSGPRRTHSYDSAGRLTRVRDRFGNCSSTSCPSGQYCEISACWTDRREFAWNSFNLPTRIDYRNPGLTRTFGYDAFGTRVRKTEDAENQVLYLGKLYEQRNLGRLGARESVYRLYTDVGVVAEIVHPWGSTSNRTVRYLFTDLQGSPVYSVVNRASTPLGFFPYGKRMGAPSQNFSQLGYTGHYQDDDLGLINMGGRIYDVATRRFLTRDAVPDLPLQVFGTNAYAYVGHDPINRIDPTGFSSALYQGQGNGIQCYTPSDCIAQRSQNPVVMPPLIVTPTPPVTMPPMVVTGPPTAATPTPTPTADELARQRKVAEAAVASAEAQAKPPALPQMSHADRQAMAANNEHMTASRSWTDRLTPAELKVKQGPGYSLQWEVVKQDQVEITVDTDFVSVGVKVKIGRWETENWVINDDLAVRAVATGPQGEIAFGLRTGGGFSLAGVGVEADVTDMVTVGVAAKGGYRGKVDMRTGEASVNRGWWEVSIKPHGDAILRNISNAIKSIANPLTEMRSRMGVH